MSEADTISDEQLPLTVDDLADQFSACGLCAGQTVLVHTSMSKIGWISGGAQSVIEALLRVLGDDGTLMMPMFTEQNTNPANWTKRVVPTAWHDTIRAHMPAYDPATMPPRRMGAVAELFRIWPGVIRSAHPIGSFCARGKHAEYLTGDHQLLDEFGTTSPLGRLYELDGYILLLGVTHRNNTSLHVAEYRATWPGKHTIEEGTSVFVNGVRQWVTYEMLDLDTSDFVTIGDAYEAHAGIQLARVGQAGTHFMKQRPLIDFAVEWMSANRK